MDLHTAVQRLQLNQPFVAVIIRSFDTEPPKDEEDMIMRYVEGGHGLDLDVQRLCEEGLLAPTSIAIRPRDIAYVLRSNARRAERTTHHLGLCRDQDRYAQASLALRELAPLPALRFYQDGRWTMRPEWTDGDRLTSYLEYYADMISVFVDNFQRALCFGLEQTRRREGTCFAMVTHEPQTTFAVSACTEARINHTLLTNGGVGMLTVSPDGSCTWNKLV